MTKPSAKPRGADRRCAPGPFDIRLDRPIPAPAVLVGAGLTAATAVGLLLLADTLTRGVLGGSIGSAGILAVAAVLRWPAFAAVAFVAAAFTLDRLFRSRRRPSPTAAEAPAAPPPAAGAPDCSRCHGLGRVLECPLWPGCGCPDGSNWSGCAGAARACPICVPQDGG